jgi:hypothetical protein
MTGIAVGAVLGSVARLLDNEALLEALNDAARETPALHGH